MGFRMSTDHPSEVRASSATKDPKKIYFFFVEGEKTEPLYFQELSKYKGKKDGIIIRLMDRWTSDRGVSNQYLIAKNVEKFVSAVDKFDEETIEILERIVESLSEDVPVFEILEMQSKIKELVELGLVEVGEEFSEQINALITMANFDPDYDRLCLILDRDPQSFKAKQYDAVLDIAQDNGYLLGLSNPNFEFFLALHLSDFSEVAPGHIALNPKVSNNRRWTEQQLKNLLKALHGAKFSKNKFDCDIFFEQFPIGLQNVKNYAQDTTQLKNHCGSSVFKILEEILIV